MPVHLANSPGASAPAGAVYTVRMRHANTKNTRSRRTQWIVVRPPHESTCAAAQHELALDHVSHILIIRPTQRGGESKKESPIAALCRAPTARARSPSPSVSLTPSGRSTVRKNRRSSAALVRKSSIIATEFALAFMGAQVAYAQQQAAAERVERVEITGTRLPAISTEGPSPVAVMNAEEIRMDGLAKPEDLLRNLPQVFDS